MGHLLIYSNTSSFPTVTSKSSEDAERQSFNYVHLSTRLVH